MLISTIIPTIGRKSLKRAVESALAQDLPKDALEVIVVNDSGGDLAKESWQRLPQVKVISTYGKERSVARNTGAAVAKGKYLHFLDDDDYLLPGAYQTLLSATARRVGWIYGGARLVRENGEVLTDHHIGVEGNVFVHVMAAEWLPLGAGLIRSNDFFAVGGFDPHFSVIEDKDLCRKIARTCDFGQVPQTVVVMLRGQAGTSTNYRHATIQSVESRKDILEKPGSFRRMRLSAGTPYWKGRMVRAYLTCVVWNLTAFRPFMALGHLGGAAAAALLRPADWVKKDFWRAVCRSHVRRNVF